MYREILESRTNNIHLLGDTWMEKYDIEFDFQDIEEISGIDRRALNVETKTLKLRTIHGQVHVEYENR